MTLDLLLDFVKHRFAVSKRKILILDYDGTLAPFSSDPAKALPYEGIRELLLKIREAGGEIVFVTGRETEEISVLFGGSPPFEIWGCHGAVHLKPNGERQAPNLMQPQRIALARAEEILMHIGFGRVERKTTSVALHWRDCPNQAVDLFREKAIQALEPFVPAGFCLLDFNGGIELRVEGFDKGFAIREILRNADKQDFPVFLGDDVTDEDGFAEMNRQGGVSVLVSPGFRETSARFLLVPPEGILIFLENWLSNLLKR